MYSSGALSNDNPTSSLYKVFLEVCFHFGHRGREGLRELKKDNFVFKFDDAGVEYAMLNFNPMEKNHQGFLLKDSEHDQWLYGTGSENYPLVFLTKYINPNPACPFFPAGTHCKFC